MRYRHLVNAGKAVLETDGSTTSVRSALTEINKCLDEVLAEQEAIAYNTLVLAWPDLGRLAQEQQAAGPTQGELI